MKNNSYIKRVLISIVGMILLTYLTSISMFDVQADDSNYVSYAQESNAVLYPEIARYEGYSRENVAENVARAHFWDSNKVILVNRDKFPDAISATNISKGRYPVLYTHTGHVSESTLEFLKEMTLDEIFILGGTLSVNDSVIHQLSSEVGVKVTRLAGRSRYDANVSAIESNYTNEEHVVIASGEVFSDALYGVSFANTIGAPVVLTKTNNIEASTVELLNNLGVEKATIIGGTLTVTQEVEKQLENIGIHHERIAGRNRYIGSAEVANSAYENPEAVIMASGEVFSDALVSAPLAQKLNVPILLVRSNRLEAEVEQYLVDKSHSIDKVYILGGLITISEKNKEAIKELTSYMIDENNPIRLLQNKKHEAKIILEAHIDIVDYEVNAEEILNLIEKGKINIDSATTIEEVDTALADALVALNAIESDVEREERLLENAADFIEAVHILPTTHHVSLQDNEGLNRTKNLVIEAENKYDNLDNATQELHWIVSLRKQLDIVKSSIASREKELADQQEALVEAKAAVQLAEEAPLVTSEDKMIKQLLVSQAADYVEELNPFHFEIGLVADLAESLNTIQTQLDSTVFNEMELKAALLNESLEKIMLGSNITYTDSFVPITRSVSIEGNGYSINKGVQILSSNVTINSLKAVYIVINTVDIDDTVITNSLTTGKLGENGIGTNDFRSNALHQGSAIITGNTVMNGAIGFYPSSDAEANDFIIRGNTVSNSDGAAISLAFIGRPNNPADIAELLIAENNLTPAIGHPNVRVYTNFRTAFERITER